MRNSTWIFIIVIVIVLIAVASIIPHQAPAPVDTATTTVATSTDNGTTTSDQAPTTTPEILPETFTLRIGQTKTIDAWSITPRTIAEDSRCPASVYCIQAGTVRVNADITVGTTTSSAAVTLMSPVVVAGKKITLTEVQPAKIKPGTISSVDYIFTFKIENADVKS